MLHNLLLGLSTMLLCLMLQLVLVLLVLRYYRNKEYLINNSSFAASLRVVGGVMLLLVIGNLAQIAIWGGMFQLLGGGFGNFNAAFYHSAVNFATLGYGDVVMSEKHKLLGPLESLNGILMIGVSTSALMNALQNAMRRTLKALENREGS